MVPLLIAVPIGAMLAWKRCDAGVLGRLKAALAARHGGALAQLVAMQGQGALAACAMALAVWVVAGSLAELAVGFSCSEGRSGAAGRGQRACRARPTP